MKKLTLFLILFMIYAFQINNVSALTCLDIKSSVLKYKYSNKNTNSEVSKLQKFLLDKNLLTEKEYFSGYGFYGLSTLSAVKKYQKQNGIITTGLVGKITKGYIKNETCIIKESKAPTWMTWGASVGKDYGAMEQFETLVGHKSQMQMFFAHWGNDQYPSTFENRMGDKSKTLLLFWEAIDYNKTASDQLDYSFDTVISGNHDDYFKKFVADAKAYGGEIILVPYSEFNGDWHPWSTTKEGNTPEKFIKSWIYIHSFFTDVPNVKFAWVPNSGSIPNVQSNQFELNYPGSRYVDYVGVDGFNNGKPWEGFNTMFGKSLPKLEKYNKPVYIFSMGVANDERKAGWITDTFMVQLHKYPYVKGWVWFNENKEEDWRINSNPESLEAFRKILN
jgi:hypothetical protein